MTLFDPGRLHYPDGTQVLGVLVEIGGASIRVRWGNSSAWFKIEPDMRGWFKIHGKSPDFAIWWEPTNA